MTVLAERPAVRSSPLGRRLSPLNSAGTAGAAVMLCLSFTPSLLPRTWLVQGVLSAVVAVNGYAIGVGVASLVRRLRPSGRTLPGLRRLRPVAAVAALPVVFFLWFRGWRWQVELSHLIGMPPPSAASWLAVLPTASAVFLAVVGAARLSRRGLHAVGVFLRGGGAQRSVQVLPGVVAVLLFGAMSPPSGAPVEATHSGNPMSYVSWSSLDEQGRAFVTGGPPADRVRTARPVRVYVGLRSAADPRARAELAVAELERAGGFTRKSLCLVIPTGSGWTDEPTLRALEEQYDGDSALVAVQYSAMPSWLSFLTGPDDAGQTATLLYQAVHRRWSQLPAETRPRLLVYGHSLGALGAQAPFSEANGLLAGVDGAVISGSPQGDTLVRRLIAGRDPGSTEAAPRLSHEPGIRFVTGAGDLAPRGQPRVLLLQHPTDPVAWWSSSLLVRLPDWLREPRGDRVLPAVRWYPVVTFWQVSADLLAALDVPEGFGHSYSAEAPAAWAWLAATPADH